MNYLKQAINLFADITDIIPCPHCEGKGRHIEYLPFMPKTPRNIKDEIPCEYCEGTGKIMKDQIPEELMLEALEDGLITEEEYQELMLGE